MPSQCRQALEANGEPLTVRAAMQPINQAHDEEGVARRLAKMPAELAASTRALAYRPHCVCGRKGWAGYARI